MYDSMSMILFNFGALRIFLYLMKIITAIIIITL